MTDTTLLDSAKLQFNVVRGLVLRDMASRFGDSRLGYLWSLVRPLAIIAVMYGGALVSHRKEVQGMPVLIFITTGYFCWLCFEFTFVTVAAVPRMSRGVLAFPHITLLDALLAGAITEWATYTVMFLIISIVAIMVEHAPLPVDPLKVLVFFWVSSWMGAAVAVWVIVIRRYITTVDAFVMPIRRIGGLFSGIVLPASAIPPAALPYFSWNPIFGLVEIMRQAWYPAYQSPIADPGYVLICLFFIVVGALVAERVTRHKQHY